MKRPVNNGGYVDIDYRNLGRYKGSELDDVCGI